MAKSKSAQGRCSTHTAHAGPALCIPACPAVQVATWRGLPSQGRWLWALCLPLPPKAEVAAALPDLARRDPLRCRMWGFGRSYFRSRRSRLMGVYRVEEGGRREGGDTCRL
jgi:hypothetical protein